MKRIILIAIIFVSYFPSFSQTDESRCPQIEFVSPNEMPFPDKPIIFSARVGEKTEKVEYVYEWTFSRGKILKGQGTWKAEFIASEEDEGTNLTVTVKVTGLPKNCPDSKSDVFGIASLPIGEPADEFGKINLDDRKARLDNFLIDVNVAPNYKGLITIDFDKRDNRSYRTLLLKNILNFLDSKKIELSRVVFAISENSGERTLLWLVPAGAKFPKYVINEKYQIIEGQKLRKKLDELFPKN